jgi:hypothetical protein
MTKRILLFAILLLCARLAAQSPWTRSRAGIFAQASFQTIPGYQSLFGDNGESVDLERRLSERAFQLYGEYGLRKKTTLLAVLTVRSLRAGAANAPAVPFNKEGALTGLGNISLALRQNLLSGRVPLTATLKVDLPTRRFDDATGLNTGYDALTVLPMLSAGMGFGRLYWFVYGAYGLRTNDYSHFANAGAEVGLQVSKIWIMAFGELVQTFENGDVVHPASQLRTGLFVNNQGYLSVGLKSLIEVNRFWGLSVSAAGAASGQKVPQSPALALGAWFKWD